VFDAEGEELALASESQRRLLAMLCLHSRTVVRSVVLEEHLGLSAGALRTSISRLRRVIGEECLVTGPAGYELWTDVDVGEYEKLVADADVSPAEQARRDLERARVLWGGQPYDEFADEPWAEVEVRRLSELHTAAMEELVVILLDAGMTPASALVAYQSLNLFTLGFMATANRSPEFIAVQREGAAYMATLPEALFPSIRAVTPLLGRRPLEEQFEVGLDIVIEGIAARLAPAGTAG
jgi:hypothetical protein